MNSGSVFRIVPEMVVSKGGSSPKMVGSRWAVVLCPGFAAFVRLQIVTLSGSSADCVNPLPSCA